MDIDDIKNASSNVMATSGTIGSVSVFLHPLVIMNISEHWTRWKAQEGIAQQVFGALIGKQKGRNVEIMNSFELYFELIEGSIIIDRDYYNSKEQQFKQVFSDMDFLGWYTTGDLPDEHDIKVHKQICEINESPVLLKLNPSSRQNELPVSIYESIIDLINGEATMLFVPLSYTVATEEAERIGVDHIARLSNNDSVEVSLDYLLAQHSAIKMLYSRLQIILQYLKVVGRGQLPCNHDIIRSTYTLIHKLPVFESEEFKKDFYVQCNDVSLITYLGIITKCCYSMNQFVNKFNILYDRQSMGRRMRGLFF